MVRIVVMLTGLASVVAGTASPVASAGQVVGNRAYANVQSAESMQGVASTVVVKGRIWKRSGRARLERWEGRHWSLVRYVKVQRHRFSARVTQRTLVARYRVRAGRQHSRVFVIRVRSRPTAPVTHTPPSTMPGPGAPVVGLVGAVGSAVGGVVSVVTGVLNPPAPAGPPQYDACGLRPAKPDGTLWSCTFDEEFNGTTLNRAKWMPQTNFVSGTLAAHACYRDDPANISVSGGALNLTVRAENPPIACQNTSLGATASYSAGSVMSYHLFAQQYGRFEARVKVAAATVPGLQETFWLWPDDRVASNVLWPAAGEIDVAETYSQYPSLAIPFLHYTANDNGGAWPGLNTAWDCQAQRGVYNVYTLDWSADRIEIDVNGNRCLVNTSGDPAFAKPYIVALSAMLGVGTNALTSQTPLPATTSIDYIRVWK